MKVTASQMGRFREDRSQPYYDRQILAAAAGVWNADTNFFQAVQTHPARGNMSVAGQLPAPKEFVVRSLTTKFWQVTVATDVPTATGWTLSDALIIEYYGGMVFYIADKEYLRLPLYMVPAGGGASYATTGASVAANWGVPEAFNRFKLNIPMVIPKQINFRVVVPAPFAAPVAFGAGAGISISCQIGLHGDERRGV